MKMNHRNLVIVIPYAIMIFLAVIPFFPVLYKANELSNYNISITKKLENIHKNEISSFEIYNEKYSIFSLKGTSLCGLVGSDRTQKEIPVSTTFKCKPDDIIIQKLIKLE